MKLPPNNTFCLDLFAALGVLVFVSAAPAQEVQTYSCKNGPYDSGVYILVAPCSTSELFIELRQTDDDRILDSKRILSRYMPPEYEVRDITGDGAGEILVYTKGGGTGVSTKQLTIYAINGTKLDKSGLF